jgi:hypothetical protein
MALQIYMLFTFNIWHTKWHTLISYTKSPIECDYDTRNLRMGIFHVRNGSDQEFDLNDSPLTCTKMCVLATFFPFKANCVKCNPFFKVPHLSSNLYYSAEYFNEIEGLGSNT